MSIERMKSLIETLNKACGSYYMEDNPYISDKEYDALYQELEDLEVSMNVILSNSPTQKVQGGVLPFLNKVKHTEPMLSAEKSKDINDVIKFMGDQDCVLSWKLDGLTLVLRYNNGQLLQAITRGDGYEGEDVTHTVKTFTNVPLTIPYEGYLEIRGEGLVAFEDFVRINNVLALVGKKLYSNPRNLAAGSVRQLNPEITKKRNLMFIAFGIVKCDKEIGFKNKQLDFLNKLGFEVVYSFMTDSNEIDEGIEVFKSKLKDLPYLTDGLIIEYNDIAYGKAQGSTGHHGKNMYAFKYSDSSEETTFRRVELNTTRTGVVSLTAIFDEVDIDGVKVTRASLHNYDIFENMQLGIGDKILVYRANSVIPQIEKNLTKSNTYEIDMHCPSCGGDIVIRTPKEARFLFCENINCPSQLVDKFVHFCSKSAMNVDGLSEAGIELFINKGYLKSFDSLYNLEVYKDKIVRLEGWGIKSYNKLIKSINKSRKVECKNLIYALGIQQIGVNGSKIIAKYFDDDFQAFIRACKDGFDFSVLEDFGSITSDSIHKWYKDKRQALLWMYLIDEIEVIKKETQDVSVSGANLSGKTFVVTGSVNHFTNRKELQEKIESLGGKVAGSVSKNTDYLINNDSGSSSSKNKKAKDLGVAIITEDKFMDMIKE